MATAFVHEDGRLDVPRVFFGGDTAFGPKNIITAVAHGHEAAVSIGRFLHGEDGCDACVDICPMDCPGRPAMPRQHADGPARGGERMKRIESGEIATGLLYIDPAATGLHAALHTVAQPLNSLHEAERYPGAEAMAAINAPLR